jgi:glycosyltransferase involved in cell wall biosynthesis
MKIYIDGMLFQHTGIGRIYQNLLQSFAESEEISRIYTLVQAGKKEEFLERYPYKKIEAKFVDLPFNYKEYFRKGSFIKSFTPRPDIYYFPYHNVPFFLKGKIISTICDLIPISPFLPLPWYVRPRFRYVFSHALKVSTGIVCISNFTKSQVIEYFHVPADRLQVVYPPLDDRLPSGDPMSMGPERMIGGDYLLYVGNRHVYKNLKCLLDAFELLLPDFPDLKLVIAGARMRRRDEVDEALEDERFRGRLIPYISANDQEIGNLYSHARVFVFPTLIEGFGIPPLEAMSRGIPAVCSDIPVIREACGKTVSYATPGDPKDFARAIRESLTKPRSAGEVLAGRERIAMFSRRKIADQYIELFKSCLTS